MRGFDPRLIIGINLQISASLPISDPDPRRSLAPSGATRAAAAAAAAAREADR